jgi:hypothetical protein
MTSSMKSPAEFTPEYLRRMSDRDDGQCRDAAKLSASGKVFARSLEVAAECSIIAGRMRWNSDPHSSGGGRGPRP